MNYQVRDELAVQAKEEQEAYDAYVDAQIAMAQTEQALYDAVNSLFDF